ncbi:hypothetical protein [Mycobacterium sp. E2479]|uniref:hypothetical protein n=1 Tax=Mycobacterium sp. E2479 TaxID=1834134 RepID=UPI000B266FCC|nr:hypothetical protein [Mycobacterium sp. E2479]
MFDTSDGHTLSVRVLDGTKIELRKFNPNGEPVVTPVELSTADAKRILKAKPTEPGTAWHIGKGLTMAPPDVDRTAEALNSALANLS